MKRTRKSQKRSLARAIGITQRQRSDALVMFELAVGTLRRVVNRIFVLALVFAGLGTYVMWKGYQFGELLIGGALTLGGQLPNLVNVMTGRRDRVTVDQPEEKPIPAKLIARKNKLTAARRRR